jgi:hypothetical protein
MVEEPLVEHRIRVSDPYALVGVPDKCVGLRFLLTEVTKGTPEDEQKRDPEQHCQGDPPPS